MQRFRFNTRSGKTGESVAPYFTELRKLAGRSLGDMIRDRLVCGINDETIQRKLLTEPDLTYTKSLSIAKGLEAAAQNLKEMKMPQRELVGTATAKQEAVHKITAPRAQSRDITCHKCADPTHLAPQCAYKDAKCNWCHKKGHLTLVCMRKAKAKREQFMSEAKPYQNRVPITRKTVRLRRH